MNYQDLFSYLAKKAIAQLDPTVNTTKSEKVKKKEECDSLPAQEVNHQERMQKANSGKKSNIFLNRSRYVPSVVKAQIWKRDQGCCSFVSANSGKVCGSKYQVQVDHIKPFALGGETKVQNLRLLCAQHNRFEAQRIFGF